MLGHMRKHHTKKWKRSQCKSSSNANSDDSIDWKAAAAEAFGDIPSSALNLRGLRNREGLTQEQFGQAIDVEQSNISKMELGKRNIGVKIAKRIEQIFNIDYRLFL